MPHCVSGSNPKCTVAPVPAFTILAPAVRVGALPIVPLLVLLVIAPTGLCVQVDTVDTLYDAFRWTSHLLRTANRDNIQAFATLLNDGSLTVGTSFSGVGTPGVALAALVGTLRTEYGATDPRFTHTSAIERLRASQSELLCSRDAPLCLFSNMLGFIQDGVRTSAMAVAQHLAYGKLKNLMLRPSVVKCTAS